MDKSLRKAIIAGNWKMNKTPAETEALIAEILPKIAEAGCDVVACVPFVDLHAALLAANGTNLVIGAQNCHYEKSGAFTGEISAPMLTAIGISTVVIGHSERRQYFGETDRTVSLRTKAALDEGMTVILCVGETLEERRQNLAAEVLERQLKTALSPVTSEELCRVVLAYEPVWAIGTGQTATTDQANEGCGMLRRVLGELYGADAADTVSILYGGSMNAGNAESLLQCPHVDGGLIGGASLKAEDFAAIVSAASK